MAAKLLAGLRVVSFEARRADELATMLARHGAEVVRAPAYVALRRLRGRVARAERTRITARDRRRFLRHDLWAFLKS